MAYIITQNSKIVTSNDRGKSIRFNGTSQYITLPSSSVFDFYGSPTKTIEVGFFIRENKASQVIFSKGGGNTNDIEALLILESRHAGKFALNYYASSGSVPVIANSQDLDVGR